MVRIKGGEEKETRIYYKDDFIEDAEKVLLKQYKIVVDVSFKTGVKLSRRVAKISDAFGIGVDETHFFKVYDNFALAWNDGDLVFITGDSGGGKSVLLRVIKRKLSAQGKKIADFSEVKVDENEVLIESIGRDVNEAMNIFSMVGLNEAFLVLRKYKELSEGQKYRYRVAKMINSGADVWVMDEFLSMLDRDTAKIVAYCIQKWARRLGKTVFVATAHKDIIEDFNPNVLVVKNFGSDAETTYLAPTEKECSIMREVDIREGNRSDYNVLKQYHYLPGRLVIKKIFKASYKGEVVGVIVYGYPVKQLSSRNAVFPEYNNDVQKVFREIIRIMRVIVHPKFRGIGLGQRLVRETMRMVSYRIVEVLAVMARYNPFFEKAGMIRVEKKRLNPEFEKLALWLENHGFNLDYKGSRRACTAFFKKLNSYRRKVFKRLIKNVMKRRAFLFSGKREERRLLEKKWGLEEVIDAMKKLPKDAVYYYWLNPEWVEKSG